MYKTLVVKVLLLSSSVIAIGCDTPSGTSNESNESNSEKKESDSHSKEDGIADAEKDIAAGKLFVWTQPLPSPPWAGLHYRLAKENGIELKSTKTTDEFKTDYIAGYNQRMKEEIDKKLGINFLQKLEEQAQKEMSRK